MKEKEPVAQFIEVQIEKWKTIKKIYIPVITVSVAPGSGGQVVAKRVAELLNFDFYDREIIKAIAQSAQISEQVIQSMEKSRFSGIQDFIASLVDDRYLWPGVYLEHLMEVVSVIAEHGHAVITGRGGNFIIPPDDHLSVRVVAPLEVRVKNIASEYNVPIDKARRRVLHRENRRAAFIKQSFHADVTDPNNFDIVINTQKTDINAAAGIIIGAIIGGKELTEKNYLR